MYGRRKIATAKKLRDKFDADLKALQDACQHPNSKRMPYMWAPGHMGSDVEVCDTCEKILETYK